MRALVTGSHGFVGKFIAAELVAHGHQPLMHDRLAHAEVQFDVTDAAAAMKAIAELKPDACIHLAAIAHVPTCDKNPKTAYEINVGGTLNLLEAFRAHAPQARFLFVSTSLIYGNKPRATPLDENANCEPDHVYGITKLSADLSTLLYHRRYGMPVMTVRPANHIGPGQSPDFVVPAFAKQLREIAAGKTEPRMSVGNLDSTREFTDVRDIVRAYRLLIERGIAGNAYNLSSGRFVTIRWILDKLCEIAGVKPEITVNPKFFRPTDTQPQLDWSRISREIGWRPEISLEQSLADIIARS